ncbi:hypothetical protein F5Y18DRAFT_169299 [Xylariaceae sp. FL1019]|nr:hypothetical protein F5Y18DRAFT_169299 [Xylariaceae sp. FL1019]
MAPLKVLISGAGIAGTALAFWLTRIGHNVTVVERYAELRAMGLQVDLRGHGIEVMKRMGLQEAFNASCAPEEGIRLVDKWGKTKAFFPQNKSGSGTQNFTSEFEIMRGDLCQIMYDATKERTRYIFGNSIKSLTDDGRSVDVSFADGATETFDLVVGADGLNSRTRSMMLGGSKNDGVEPLDGVCVGYFSMPKPMQTGEQYLATAYIAPGNKGCMVRRAHPDKLQVYIGVGGNTNVFSKVPRNDIKAEKSALTEFFQGAGWEIPEILKSMNTDNDFYLERMALVKLDRWYRGNVALTGDAAWCPTANTGMGTTCAVVGAYMLAGEISKFCGRGDTSTTASSDIKPKDNISKALAAYDDNFRPFMDQVQKGVKASSGFGSSLLSTSLGISLIHVFFGVISYFKVNVGAMFLKEEIHDWDLPDYEELLRK